MNCQSLISLGVKEQRIKDIVSQFRRGWNIDGCHPLLQVLATEVGELTASGLEVLYLLLTNKFIEIALLDTKEEASLVGVVDVLGL